MRTQGWGVLSMYLPFLSLAPMGDGGDIGTNHCSFVHVFSPFAGASREDLSVYRHAEQSWQVAASAASADGAADVRFLAAVLPRDRSAAPQFAGAATLSWYVVDGLNRTLPTVGGILTAAMTAASNRGHVILTNWDIAVVRSFYIEACRRLKALSRADPTKVALDITRVDLTVPGDPARWPSAADLGLLGDRPGSQPAKEARARVMAVAALRKHPGHDCFIIPASLPLRCLTETDPGFAVGQPPWGAVLRSVLSGTILDSSRKFEYVRSLPKKQWFTYHLHALSGERGGVPGTFQPKPLAAAWQTGSVWAHLELMLFQYAQTFRMAADRNGSVAVSCVLFLARLLCTHRLMPIVRHLETMCNPHFLADLVLAGGSASATGGE